MRVSAGCDKFNGTRAKFPPQSLNQIERHLRLIAAGRKNLPPIQPHPVEQFALACRQTSFHPTITFLVFELMQSYNFAAGMPRPLLVDARACETQINDQVPARTRALASRGNIFGMQQKNSHSILGVSL
jgi:hypothetical protein